jgi:hypothetical protein
VLAIRFVFNAMALNFLHVFNVLLDISCFLKLVQLFVLKVFMVTHLHQHAFLVFHLAEPAKISKTGVFLVSDLLLLQTNFFSKTLNV